MKRIVLIALAGLIAGPALAGTTTVRNGNNSATITESAGPAGPAEAGFFGRLFGAGRAERQTAGNTATIVDAPAPPAASADPAQQDTTAVRNGNNSATITQSGDPAKGYRQVERWDGHTRIEQRNGSNASVITQDGPGSRSPLDDDPFFKD